MAMAMAEQHNWVGLRVKEVLQDYVHLNTEAALHRKIELEAVLLIQRKWRGHAVREKYDPAQLEQTAITIQRYYRGHATRGRYKNLQYLRDKQLRMAYFNRQAAVIQSRFRGNCVRESLLEFSARKGFLQAAGQAGDVVKKLLLYNYHLQCRAKEEEKGAKMKEEMDKLFNSDHHLVGTKHIKGVCYAPTLDGGRSEVEEILHNCQRKAGRRAEIQKVHKRMRESNRLYTFNTASIMHASPYKSYNDGYGVRRKTEALKNISTDDFLLQIGPTRQKLDPNDVPFRLQEPSGYQKFLRKQEKLRYEAMYPKLVEHPFRVIFPSGRVFDDISAAFNKVAVQRTDARHSQYGT